MTPTPSEKPDWYSLSVGAVGNTIAIIGITAIKVVVIILVARAMGVPI